MPNWHTKEMIPEQRLAYRAKLEAIDAAGMMNSGGDTPTNITPA